MSAMRSTSTPSRALQARLRSAVYEFLSAAFLYPEEGTLEVLRESAPAVGRILDAWGVSGPSELLEGIPPLWSGTLEEARRSHGAVFGHTVGTECPPYETEYGQPHVFGKSRALAGLMDFYGAFGLRPQPQLHERPDHLSLELELMHVLTLREARALEEGLPADRWRACRRAQKRFLEEHLGAWAPRFAERLLLHHAESAYAPLARLLGLHLQREQALLEVRPQTRGEPVPLPAPELEDGCAACPVPAAALAVAAPPGPAGGGSSAP